jgi:hypothetical protein
MNASIISRHIKSFDCEQASPPLSLPGWQAGFDR